MTKDEGMGMRRWQAWCAGAALVLALVPCGCAAAPAEVAEPEPAPEPTATLHVDLMPGVASALCQMTAGALEEGSAAWLEAFAHSRMVEVSAARQDVLAFGPWEAAPDYGAADARGDGSLTEWADHYYITHDWSDIGRQILSMVPGDTVTVNGRTVQVVGIFNYPKDSYYDEIIALVGEDTVVFQTCYPDSDLNRIVCAL